MQQLKESLVAEQTQLIQQLESTYSNRISHLLSQKAYIHQKIQIAFYEKLFEIQNLMFDDVKKQPESFPRPMSIDEEHTIPIPTESSSNGDTFSVSLTGEPSTMTCGICGQFCRSKDVFCQHIQSHVSFDLQTIPLHQTIQNETQPTNWNSSMESNHIAHASAPASESQNTVDPLLNSSLNMNNENNSNSNTSPENTTQNTITNTAFTPSNTSNEPQIPSNTTSNNRNCKTNSNRNTSALPHSSYGVIPPSYQTMQPRVIQAYVHEPVKAAPSSSATAVPRSYYGAVPPSYQTMHAPVPTLRTANNSLSRNKKAELFKNAGNLLLKQHKYQEGIDEYTKAIALDPINAVYYSNRAAAHYQLKNYIKAVDDARKAWCINPTYTKAYIREGWAEYKMKRYQKAFVAFSKALLKMSSIDRTDKTYEDIQAKVKLCQAKMEIPNMNDRWRCDYCNTIFISKNSLYRHSQSHNECMAFNVMAKKTKPKTSENNDNQTKQLHCQYCPFTTPWSTTLRRHEDIHQRTTPYAFKCSHCSYNTRRECVMQQHQLVHTKEYAQQPKRNSNTNLAETQPVDNDCITNQMFKCLYCEKTGKEQKQIDNHTINIHTPNHLKPHKCRYCSYGAATNGAIRLHEQRVHKRGQRKLQRPFECDKCNTKFARKHHLAQHSKQHDGVNPFLCSLCNKQFKEKHQLKQHIEKMHEKNTRNINISKLKHPRTTDETTDEYIINNSREGSDEDTVTKEQTGFQCCYCELICETWDGLEKHMTVHDENHETQELNKNNTDTTDNTHEENGYECSICLKRFKKKKYLKVHFRIHSGEKPYSCDQCGDTFRTWTMMDVHLKKHFGKYRYKCDICKSKFTQKSLLNQHLTWHSQNKENVDEQ
eukprot:254987_1